MSVFKAVPERYDFPAEEARIVSSWKERGIFAKSLERRAGSPTFVFYEGPPTANGLPHNGHVLTRVIKDVFPRYKTMRGFRVPRKAGWDTHGLPVEIEGRYDIRGFLSWEGVDPKRYKQLADEGKGHHQIMRLIHTEMEEAARS
mgnify:CR=1 FL=1